MITKFKMVTICQFLNNYYVKRAYFSFKNHTFKNIKFALKILIIGFKYCYTKWDLDFLSP